MELRIKILIVTILVAFLPTSIVAAYVMTNIIPQYEKITYNYFVTQQEKSLERIKAKVFEDMTNFSKEYAIWNEIYEAVLMGKLSTIEFYWTNWLYQKPYDFSIIVGFDKQGKIICSYSKYQSIKDININKLSKIVQKTISKQYIIYKEVSLIPVEKGFIKFNDKIYAFVCCPVLDDKNLSRPVIGALFLARDIKNFVSLIQPYVVNNVYFQPKESSTRPNRLLRNEIAITDIDNNILGSIVLDYDEKPLVLVKKHFENLLIAMFMILTILTLLISFISGMYLTNRILKLEEYAIGLFSRINGEATLPKPNVKKEGKFENVETILTYFSNEIKSKISLLKTQDDLLRELFEKERRNFEGAIKLLISIIEMKDPYTKGHAERVMQYSKKIGQKLVNQKGYKINLFDLEIAAYLHDIGKIVVPENILNKRGKLTDEEYSIVKRHSLDGYNILSNIEYFDSIKDIVLYHHENLDGTGYPLGINGDKIPVESRIIAIADVFDALTTDRPYRKAFSEEEALIMMKNDVGKKFDPEIFEVFLEVLAEEKISNVEMKIDGQV
ncbi:metal dependent phosphohydrolase [Caldicellulosiruptor saccharolyticus DSM 8903]|uniref:Metal dependent phosphohydrolase n=1 Tax=Caldicellulosiruptor saccharolyticus (strain ATCC 43494 / DSM 8903 / Tp8T 6331) TaxID=351627 RepID=A4XI23_CALS8|nr:HD domain-containing phosphohydrolase [Caldicellulosiruptor saccharolyticus]ABP66558.1 metal dependent phosphohydrolase [Caldicellulosiruptor saccharolyticus DSM 8903]